MAFTEITVTTDADGSVRTMVRSVELHTRLVAGDRYYFGGSYNPGYATVLHAGGGPDNRTPMRATLESIPQILFNALLTTGLWKEK